MSVFFKVKNSKRSNPEARTTLDAIHNQHVQQMLDEKNNVNQYIEDLQKLKLKIKGTTSTVELWRLERDAEVLEKKIKSIENETDMMDYYLRTGDILYNYYDIQEQIQQGNYAHTSNKAKPGSILAILEEVAQEEGLKQGEAKPVQKALQRNQLLNEYLQLEDPSMVRNTIDDYEDSWTICEKCSSEMIICLNEANITCSKYYEHIPHIINRLNGQNAPFMSREDEEKLRHMFREIQPSFKKHCPKGRRNFLSYSYVLYKFCELLELDEYLACFPLLKNRDKLYMQDKTWKLICEDMGWGYIRTCG